MESYSISQVAHRFGLEPHTLRFYVKEGVIQPQRTAGGIRYFTEEDLSRLEMALCLKNTGMSLKDIRRYFQLVGEGDDALEQRLQIFLEHREHVMSEIAELQKHLCKINHKLDWCRQTIDERDTRRKAG